MTAFGGEVKGDGAQSTQNTQYDQIGKKYNGIKKLPVAEPEIPSVMAVLNRVGIEEKRCLGSLSSS